ncbi:hypothetical protein IFR04_003143 [Cadophora malorum]|uniref:Uncharacterized protein n=1 Tax=Cadophora malorum TaxID=108018 RepID=A0A8H7WF22_9HELO|nr:hypothetical protein IFR04_003143 [Cadophora malorum]
MLTTKARKVAKVIDVPTTLPPPEHYLRPNYLASNGMTRTSQIFVAPVNGHEFEKITALKWQKQLALRNHLLAASP